MAADFIPKLGAIVLFIFGGISVLAGIAFFAKKINGSGNTKIKIPLIGEIETQNGALIFFILGVILILSATKINPSPRNVYIVRGNVSFSGTHAPVVNAVVKTSLKKDSVLTNNNGYYEIKIDSDKEFSTELHVTYLKSALDSPVVFSALPRNYNFTIKGPEELPRHHKASLEIDLDDAGLKKQIAAALSSVLGNKEGRYHISFSADSSKLKNDGSGTFEYFAKGHVFVYLNNRHCYTIPEELNQITSLPETRVRELLEQDKLSIISNNIKSVCQHLNGCL